jgi:hypothetical protein
LHVACIQSSSGQIMLHHQLESRFTGDELRVMYIAVCELRETMNSVLDSRSAEDGAREKAFLHLKAANALLRRLKAEMQRVGFELDAALASAYTN